MPFIPPERMEAQAFIFNHDYPIVKLQKFNGALRVVRENTTDIDKQNGGKRKKVKELSRASLKRLAFLVVTSPIMFKSIITLTYSQAVPTTGTSSKEHLNTFLMGMKRQFGRFAYVWFLEFQNRGAPHYHILTDIDAPSSDQREAMAVIWHNSQKELLYIEGNFTRDQRLNNSNSLMKVHSHRKAWEGVRKKDGLKFYVVKYASKKEQKKVPEHFQDVGRFWGNSRDVPSKEYTEIDVTEADLREYLEKKGMSVAKALILPKMIIDLK